jgi:hypothetical protein
MRRVGLVVSLCALLFVAVPVQVTHGQGGGADFTRFVGVGDSLTSGFRDGALHASAQETSFYALLAESANAQVSIPLIAEPGIPTPDPATGSGLLIQRPGTCAVGQFDFATGQTTGRIHPEMMATNVAVPGQTVGDALNVKWSITVNGGQVDPTSLDGAEDFVLGFPYVLAPAPLNTPRSQIETAVGLQPTFVSFWLGSGDALTAALAGTVNAQTLTPVPQFNTNVDAAAGAFADPNTKGVVFNVPDVTVIPYLFSIADLSQLTGLDEAQVRLALKLKAGSYVPLSALPTVTTILLSGQGKLTKEQKLTKGEIKKIQKAIDAYNTKLQSIADAKGWAFVDVNGILAQYHATGVAIPGVGTLTTGYLGGLFGLDGIHPSATGHALIAAAAVLTINAKYGTTLGLPDVPGIAAADPEVCMAGAAKRLTLADVAQYAPAARAAESIFLRHRGL